ncbi:MAG: hypothetical protein KF685_10920 [Acidobacteria bacterium]|nr:hypothetical protein [Acidobacteriota bacterium]
MKTCPACQRTYADDALNFCLEDGSVLTLVTGEPPPTVVMQAPPSTTPFQTPSTSNTTQSSWDANPEYSLQPKKSSRGWLWAGGLVGIGLLLCGGGLVGFIALAMMQDQGKNDPDININNNRRQGDNRNDRGNTATTNTSEARYEKIELSGWVDPAGTYGKTEFSGGEFFMTSQRADYNFVLVAKPQYSTENSRTNLTVSNPDDGSTNLGFGLVFHSNPQPLQQGYAFLIDSKRRRYRVVRHEKLKEQIVANWKVSNAIKTGSAANTLSVTHKGNMIDLMINGELVTSIPNTYGYKNGVAGLYSGGGVRAGFKDFEIGQQ